MTETQERIANILYEAILSKNEKLAKESISALEKTITVDDFSGMFGDIEALDLFMPERIGSAMYHDEAEALELICFGLSEFGEVDEAYKRLKQLKFITYFSYSYLFRNYFILEEYDKCLALVPGFYNACTNCDNFSYMLAKTAILLDHMGEPLMARVLLVQSLKFDKNKFNYGLFQSLLEWSHASYDLSDVSVSETYKFLGISRDRPYKLANHYLERADQICREDKKELLIEAGQELLDKAPLSSVEVA